MRQKQLAITHKNLTGENSVMADNKFEKTYDSPLKIVRLPMFNRFSGKPEWVDGKPQADKLQWSVMNDTYLSFTIFLKDNGGIISHSIYLTEAQGIFDRIVKMYLSGEEKPIQYNLIRDFYKQGSKTTVETGIVFGITDGLCWIGFAREGLRKVKFEFGMVGDNEIVIKDKEENVVQQLSPYLISGYLSNLLKQALKSCQPQEPEFISSSVGGEETVKTKAKEPAGETTKPMKAELIEDLDDDIPF